MHNIAVTKNRYANNNNNNMNNELNSKNNNHYVYVWGGGLCGCLGLGKSEDVKLPVQLAFFENTKV